MPFHRLSHRPETSLRLIPDFTSALSHTAHDPDREARRVISLTPRLSPTYSMPSTSAPPPPPYGVERRVARAVPKSRAEFLEEARRLLQAPTTDGGTPRMSPPPFRETYAVRFTWTEAAERSVFLTGSFNEWGLPIAMARRVGPHGDVWDCVLRLRVGEYRYKYIVDGEWRVDEGRLCERVDGVAIANRLIIESIDHNDRKNRSTG